MGVGERLVNGGTGAVKSGVIWGLVGAAAMLLLCVGGGAVVAGLIASHVVAGSVTAAVLGGVVGGIAGGVAGTMMGWVGGTGFAGSAALGALWGGARGLFGRSPSPEIAQNDRLIERLNAEAAIEETRARAAMAQRERLDAMGETPNPDARVVHTERLAKEAAAQQSAAPAAPSVA